MRISDWSSDVCSSDLETFTVIASEAEVRFALGLLPGASLPSPTHVAARLTGDLPGEVTLSLNPVKRSITASDAAASIRDGGWSFGPFPTAALGQDARRMAIRLSLDDLRQMSWDCVDAVARPCYLPVRKRVACGNGVVVRLDLGGG